MSRLGENIFVLRVRNRMTIKQLAERSQVGKYVIIRLEIKGNQARNESIEKIAKVLGVESRQLRFGEFKIEEALGKNEDSIRHYLEALCIAKRITQSDLARMSGLSRATINKIMNEGCIPTNETISKLARTLDFPEDKFQTKITDNRQEIENLSRNVRILCNNNRMNLTDLEKVSGVSRATITAILSKKEGYNPSKEILEKIANTFGITASTLIFGKIQKINIEERVARNIEALCELHCMTQFELGEVANLSHSMISEIIKYNMGLKGESLKRIAIAFDIPEEDLYYDDFFIEAQWISRNYVRSNMLRLCEERKITLKELSEKAGLTMRTILTISEGKGKPSIKTVRKIAEAFGVMPQVLMNLPEEYRSFNFEKR